MVGRLALVAMACMLVGVFFTSEEVVALGGVLSAATIVAWVVKVRPHNHWRGFRRHRF